MRKSPTPKILVSGSTVLSRKKNKPGDSVTVDGGSGVQRSAMGDAGQPTDPKFAEIKS
jgi:hypothetical protein